jgi:hypothetical protein
VGIFSAAFRDQHVVMSNRAEQNAVIRGLALCQAHPSTQEQSIPFTHSFTPVFVLLFVVLEKFLNHSGRTPAS